MSVGKGVFRSPYELVVSLSLHSPHELVICENPTDKFAVRKTIEGVKGINEETRRIYFEELDRLFDVTALQKLSRK